MNTNKTIKIYTPADKVILPKYCGYWVREFENDTMEVEQTTFPRFKAPIVGGKIDRDNVVWFDDCDDDAKASALNNLDKPDKLKISKAKEK